MVLKKLFELQEIKIESILVREQKRLNLTSMELVVLIAFFQTYKRSVFSINSLTRRTSLIQNEVEETVDSLIEKGFVLLSLDSKDGKAREVFSLDQTFEKIEELWHEDIRQANENKYETDISKTITILEKHLNRSLSSRELETVKDWYSLDGFSSGQVLNAIDKTNKSRLSIKLINSILHQPEILEKFEPLSEERKKVIDEIFKAIKWQKKKSKLLII